LTSRAILRFSDRHHVEILDQARFDSLIADTAAGFAQPG
jgi:hypothetical protein